MHPYLIHVGRLALPTFAVLAALGIAGALVLSERTAHLLGLPPEKIWNAGLFAVVSAFVLSRLLLIATNLHTFFSFPVLLLAVPSLTPLGAGLAAAATLLYLRFRRLPILPTIDAWAPCGTLLWAALALGHFAEGSDPGLPGRPFPAVQFAGAAGRTYPVALFAAAIALLLTAFLMSLLVLRTRNAVQDRSHTAHHAGQIAAIALAGSGLAQFLLSFLREPGSSPLFGLDELQWVSLGMMAAGGVLLAYTLVGSVHGGVTSSPVRIE